MSNPYLDYYKSQAGSGIVGFQGVRYQRGHGFFGRILSKAVFPMLKFLGRRALGVGADIASDVIVDKQNLKQAVKRRFEDEGTELAKAGIKRAKKYVQTGGKKKSIKRRTKKRTKKTLTLNQLINQNA